MLSAEARAFAKEMLAIDVEDAIARFQQLAKQRTSKSARLLLELLHHRRTWIRERALDALWEFGRIEDARHAARIAIRSENRLVRDMAAEMMEEVGTRQDAPILIQILRSDRWEVARASAASSLGELRTAPGEQALCKAITSDRSWLVRAYAANALTRTGNRKFRAFIEDRIKQEKEPAVIVSLYASMIDMGSKDYIEKVIDVLYDPDHWYMVYLRAAVILEDRFLERGEALPDRAILGLKRMAKSDAGMAARWKARDVLREAGINVRVPGPAATSKSSGKKRA